MAFYTTYVGVLLLQAVWALPFAPQPLDNRTYSETFTTIAMLDDGTYVQVQLAISNLGLEHHKAVCRALIARPDTPVWQAEETFAAKHWFFSEVPQPTLKIGTCQATTSAHSTHVDIELADTSVLISVAKAVNPVEPPQQNIETKDYFYKSEIYIPFAPVEVVVAPANGLAKTQHGFAYMDHSRATSLPKDLGRGWWRFRGFAPHCSSLFLARFAADPNALPQAYFWREGAGRPEKLTHLNLDPSAIEASNIHVQSHERVFALNTTRHVYRDAPLERNGILGRVARAFVGNVVTDTYIATLDDIDDKDHHQVCKHVIGVLEIEHM